MTNLHTSIGNLSKPMSSVMRQNAGTQHKTLKTILHDVEAAHPDLTKSDHKRIAKTIKRITDDPSSVHVLSHHQKKEALEAISASGNLREKYSHHIGSAIKTLTREADAMKDTSIDAIRKKSPSQRTEEENAKLRAHENRMRAEAAKARKKAEGTLYTDDHKITRFGLEEWQDASVSANSALNRKSRYQLQQDTDEKADDARHTPPLVDMMID